jgi:hypothetical protein
MSKIRGRRAKGPKSGYSICTATAPLFGCRFRKDKPNQATRKRRQMELETHITFTPATPDYTVSEFLPRQCFIF